MSIIYGSLRLHFACPVTCSKHEAHHPACPLTCPKYEVHHYVHNYLHSCCSFVCMLTQVNPPGSCQTYGKQLLL